MTRRASKIRLLLCDGQRLFRQGLRRLLDSERDFQVVGEAATAAQALELLASTRPEVILTEIDLPGGSGLELTRALTRHDAATSVIIVTARALEAHFGEAMAAGAAAYLPKEAEPAHLERLIRRVARSPAPPTPEEAYRLAARASPVKKLPAQELPARGLPPLLSEREQQILHLVGQGYGNREIAATLQIKEKTVRNHLTDIFRLLGFRNRTEAALYALRTGLAQLHPEAEEQEAIPPPVSAADDME